MVDKKDLFKEAYDNGNADFKRYVDFAVGKRILQREKGAYYERHHLFPRALYPELVKDKRFLITLKPEDHIRAHYLLYRAFPNEASVIYAFNMMLKRGDKSKLFQFSKSELETIFESDDVCIEYTEFRKKVVDILRDAHTGLKATDETKAKLSALNKGKINVRIPEGEVLRVSVDDPRLKSGEFVYAICGRSHTEETKRKMSENGIKGRICVHDENGVIKYVSEEETKNYTVGYTEERKQKLSDAATDLFFYVNETTGETKRIKKGEPVPEGFIRKRVKCGKFVGFDTINENIRVFDIKDKAQRMVPRTAVDFRRHILLPLADNAKNNYLVFNGFVFVDIEALTDYLLDIGITIRQPYSRNLGLLIKNIDEIIVFTTKVDRKYGDESDIHFENRKAIARRIQETQTTLRQLLPDLKVVNILDLEYGAYVLKHSKQKVAKYGR